MIYPAKRIWEDFLEGFSSFYYATRHRFEDHEWWYFWEEINSGWMREYIYPYDDFYNAIISEERQLRLDQHPPDLSKYPWS